MQRPERGPAHRLLPRLSVICVHSLPLSDSRHPAHSTHMPGGPPLQSPTWPTSPPSASPALQAHLATASPGPLSVHLPVQSARISPPPGELRICLQGFHAGPLAPGWRGQRRPGRCSPRARTGRSAGARRNQGPASAASGQPAGEGRPRRKRTSCQGSTAAWEEMEPINPHLPLQIGVQAERWKN